MPKTLELLLLFGWSKPGFFHKNWTFKEKSFWNNYYLLGDFRLFCGGNSRIILANVSNLEEGKTFWSWRNIERNMHPVQNKQGCIKNKFEFGLNLLICGSARFNKSIIF